MMDERNRVIIRRISRSEQTGAQEEETRVYRTGGASRWLAYLLLVPVFIVMAVLGIFFFTAFLALFAVAAAGLGLRLWWLRRKLRESMEAAEGGREATAGEYVIIEDAEIIEESTGKVNETSGDKRQ